MVAKSTSLQSRPKSTNIIMLNSKQVLDTEGQTSSVGQNQYNKDDDEMKKSKVVKINVGGEIIMSTRDILTRIRNSKLASMINGNCEDIPAFDCDGNIFLNYNPILFYHLLEQLRTLEDENFPIFYPPKSRLLVIPFRQMFQELGFPIASLSNDDIITINVGGEIFVTRCQTLTQIPHSKLAIVVSSYRIIDTDENGYLFLDYDARLFRYLLSQLRSTSCSQISTFQAPSSDDRKEFNAMLIRLGLIDKI
ncbi:unnamed protein product [Rotaria sp. Silwood2]|nr:unnamed protein product [Rotaria sp. Silwood2]CAF4204205.1 unnamed protein product [Rotaria sp. Silwood2]